jgi:phosphatidylglycerophosphate synthase
MKSDERIKRVLSHPNTLTLFRVVAVPIVVILMIYPNRVFSARPPSQITWTGTLPGGADSKRPWAR